MRVEQAVYASAESSRMKGYQLVSRSEGIDRAMAHGLCRWAPSHAALADPGPNAWSLNYFRVDPGHVAVARTTLGAAEYSGRGGRDVVTLFLVVSTYDFAGYDYDAVALARTALALGYLRLPNSPRATVTPVRLPDRAVPLTESPRSADDAVGGLLDQTRELLLDARRVAVIGCPDPLAAVEQLLAEMPEPVRSEISFATALNWSVRREFQLQFLPAVDPGLQQKLAAEGIVCKTHPAGNSAVSRCGKAIRHQ